MIAAWMLHAVVTALVIGLAGIALEGVARLAGRPTRWVWAAALAASLLVPAARLATATREAAPAASDADATVSGAGAGAGAVPSAVDAAAADAWLAALLARAELAVAEGSPWRRLDAPLLAGWVLLTAMVMGWGLAGLVRLRRARREWVPAVMQGTPVLVSGRTGPALAGLLRPRVVLPEWALASEPAELSLMLAHEQEHERAGDPWLLAAAAVAVALCPWNASLWWQLRRLRLAVEVDCDRRVLQRHPGVRRYGALLLAVGRRSVGPRLPLAALGTPAATLERRIRAMTMPRPTHARLRAGLLVTVAAMLGAAACEMPRPTEVAPERTIPLAQVRSGEGFAPSENVTIEQVRAALQRAVPAEQLAARTGGRREIWMVADAGGKLLRAELRRAPTAGLSLTGSPAEITWTDSTTRIALGRPRVEGRSVGVLTASLAPESIESVEVLKLAPGVVIADSASVVWVRLKPGATLDGAASRVATSAEASRPLPRALVSGDTLPYQVGRVVQGRELAARAMVADSTPRPSPLYIVDGVEMAAHLTAGGAVDLPVAPDAIESVEVLKGAAAARIYGERGVNGVIVITTKKP